MRLAQIFEGSRRLVLSAGAVAVLLSRYPCPIPILAVPPARKTHQLRFFAASKILHTYPLPGSTGGYSSGFCRMMTLVPTGTRS